MNGDESNKLTKIHNTVQETATRTRVIDERTKNQGKRLDRLENMVIDNRDDINGLEDSVKRNTTILGGIGTVFTGVVLWASDKITRII